LLSKPKGTTLKGKKVSKTKKMVIDKHNLGVSRQVLGITVRLAVALPNLDKLARKSE
jgi:hypothetical protein